MKRPSPARTACLIPSLKVATYDLAPEMKAEAIGDAIVKASTTPRSTSSWSISPTPTWWATPAKLEPTISAIEAVDAQLGRIYKAIKEKNGSWLITADHGNAELMVDPVTGGPHTAHTTNPVPLIYVAEDGQPLSPAARWLPARHFADAAEPSQDRSAEADDGRRSARAAAKLNFVQSRKGLPRVRPLSLVSSFV